MAHSRNNEWDTNREVYTPDQVEAVLREIGVEVHEETENDFLSFCPFHGNFDSPAFSTSKRHGYSICFNPSCGAGSDPSTGALTLERLVRSLKGVTHIEARRLIMLKKNNNISFKERFDSLKPVNKEMQEFPSIAIDTMHQRFMETQAAKDYMAGRGFTLDTMEHFMVGFTLASSGPVYRAQDMVVVPAYDHKGMPVGLVGRSLVGKEFKNYGPDEGGRGFHKSKIVWNLQNARRHETIILAESTFDAMRIHQSGYPNVGALLGGTLSETQAEMIMRHFSTVIIFTDNENAENGQMTYPKHCAKCLRSGLKMCAGHRPGRDLGMKIAETLPRTKIKWATYDDKSIYARNVKDASDMTDDEIRQCLRNSVSHFEYLDWTR